MWNPEWGYRVCVIPLETAVNYPTKVRYAYESASEDDVVRQRRLINVSTALGNGKSEVIVWV